MRRNIGIYNLHMQAMGGGEKLTLVLAEHLSLAHNVWLFCSEPLDVPSLEQFFGVDLSRVTVSPLNGVGSFLRVAAKVRGRCAPVFSLHHYLQLRKLKLDILINNSYGSGLMCPAAQGIFMCMFPHSTPRLLSEHLTQGIRKASIDWIERQVTNPSVSNAVDSYSTVVAISQYSAHWVRKMWNRRSELIYPPCDNMGPPATKQNIILNVGRFMADRDEDERHHKRQGLLLEAFSRMTDLHREGWELHFAGSIGGDEKSENVAETLMQEADGVPVFFHLNAARDEILNLYRKAAIYWHGTGYGFDAHRYPAKQEHFGITTVEAMSAAAVPVVYSSGGQKEIVADGVDGFWWNDIDGLISQTRRLANDPALRCELSHQAVVSSKRFGREAFTAKVDQLLAELPS
jgi:glycosyltransferase involved in cell wall biosynthesis